MDYHQVISSQYFAALEMVKQAILACPETLWFNPDDRPKFSQAAYHALFFTHFYLQESEQAFRPWSGHREEYRLDGDLKAPSAAPATKEIVLDYLAFCQNDVLNQISTIVLDAPSGF